MHRVVSVWFPQWPTDRLRRRLALLPPEGPGQRLEADTPPITAPLVTVLHDGRRRVIAAADRAASAAGLRPGMAVAQAMAILPGLQVKEAELQADTEALCRLARWCHRITPLVSADEPDGLWLDITGCAHLFGGETRLLRGLVGRLAQQGLHARAAVADTPGAAHAMARFADAAADPVVLTGEQAASIGPLPVEALRLPADLVTTLRRLGFEQVGHLARIPRALLARRFGAQPGLRLDQAHGRVHEPLTPLLPEQAVQRREVFLEPLLTAEALQIAIGRLVEPLCTELERSGLGARQLDLLFERVDSHVAALRIGTARPSRDARHLVRLLQERLETVDPGMGVEAMHLVAPHTEPLDWEQQESGGPPKDMARLVDRLSNRLGPGRVYRAAPVESALPERSVRKADDAALATGGADRTNLEQTTNPEEIQAAAPQCSHHLVEMDLATEAPSLPWKRSYDSSKADLSRSALKRAAWPERLHAPTRLLDPPRPVEALAALPDQPPVAFTWRRRRHRIRRADGPERIVGEWWKDADCLSVRDYFRVEDETGQRFWLFRNGNGIDPSTGDLSWFLHGLF